MYAMDFKKEIGERIRRARRDKDLTLDQLAQKTGDRLTLKRINAYENGDRMPGPLEAAILAKALGVRPAYIMALDDTQIPITHQEEALIRNWRKLPENARMSHYRKIEQEAVAYTDILAPEPERRPTKVKQ